MEDSKSENLLAKPKTTKEISATFADCGQTAFSACCTGLESAPPVILQATSRVDSLALLSLLAKAAELLMNEML